jgi:hypothetical protein
MQTKLKAVVVAVVIASTAPLWWPAGAAHEAAAAPAAGVSPDRSGGSSAAGRSDPSPASPLRAERSPVAGGQQHAPPAEVQRFRASGRVCNCDGTAIANVLVAAEGASAVTARSDALGNFELELTTRSASVAAAEDRFVTVCAGEWSSEATIEPVVVVAKAVSLAGRVVAADGAPVARSQLLLQLPDDFDSRFQVPLDRAGRRRWARRAVRTVRMRCRACRSSTAPCCWSRPMRSRRSACRCPRPTPTTCRSCCSGSTSKVANCSAAS